MISVDTCLHCEWLVTVDAHNTVLENYTVVIDKGRIYATLPSLQARQIYTANEDIDLPGHAVMPGLINTHTHTAMSLLRGFADDLPLMDWLQKYIWPAESKYVDAQFIEDGSTLAIAEMLRGGTTCFNDMYFFPDATARSASRAGIRAVVGLIVLDFPTVWANSADEYIAKGTELHDTLRNNPLVSTAFAPHAPYTVSEAPLRKIATYSNELEIPVHIHVHETASEVEQFIAAHGVRPLQHLDQLGLVSPSLLAVHMTQLLEREIERIAEAGAHILHCPESNMKLASGFCPVGKLLDANCNIALGTDGAASNNDLDMFGEMRTAALIAKGASGDAAAFPAAQVLRAATINGARALGMENEIGSVEMGKAADLVAVDFNRPALRPVYDPVSHLVYAAGRDDVSDVWVAGKALLRNRQLLHMDELAIQRDAQQWARKINTLN